MRAMSGGGRRGTCPSLQEKGRGQDLNRSGAINNIRTISNCKKGKEGGGGKTQRFFSGMRAGRPNHLYRCDFLVK